MRKIFLSLTLLLTFLTATAFAAEENSTQPVGENSTPPAEENSTSQAFEYTSQTYGFKIACPAEPKVVVNPFEDPNERGELLVFANDGMKILYGYQIKLDAFDNNAIPDLNKANKKTIDAYLEKLRQQNVYEHVEINNISPDNKAIFAVTAKEMEVELDDGEIGVLTADTQNAIAFFRTKSGRCISIQFITDTLDDEAVANFGKSVMSYRDATDLAMPDKKSDKKKSKK